MHSFDGDGVVALLSSTYMSCRHPGDDEFRMNRSPADVGAGPMSADRVVGQAEYELDSTKRQLCNDGVSC